MMTKRSWRNDLASPPETSTRRSRSRVGRHRPKSHVRTGYTYMRYTDRRYYCVVCRSIVLENSERAYDFRNYSAGSDRRFFLKTPFSADDPKLRSCMKFDRRAYVARRIRNTLKSKYYRNTLNRKRRNVLILPKRNVGLPYGRAADPVPERERMNY